MQQIANMVRGWAEIEVRGSGPEEFVNRCARENLPIWHIRKADAETWTLRTSFPAWFRVKKLGGDLWEVRTLRLAGVPGLLWTLRKRYALLVGLALSMAVVAVLSQFLLTVRVSGNRKVPTAAILSQLRANGVRPGTFGPGVDVRQVCHRVMLELPELSWMTINRHGTVAEVLVREGTPPPELVEEDVPAHIVARYTGIITRMETTRGMALVGEGDTVVAGDTLIDSYVDFIEPEGYIGDMGGMTVRAGGKIWARVWHTLRGAVPLESREKVLTGEEKSRWSLEIYGHGVNFFGKGGIPYGECDKITKYHTLRLPGGITLPISLRRDTFRAYTTQSVPIDKESALEVLRAELLEQLEDRVGEGEIRKLDWSVSQSGGLLTLTLLAECEQQIGRTVED